MKFRLPFVLALLFFAQASFAQLGLGVKVGANITKIDGQSFNNEFKYGYHLGGFATIGLGGSLSLQPEVLFNEFSSRTDSSFKNVYQNAVSNASDVKLNYLSIPILLNYKVAGPLSLQLGPQFGILLDKNQSLLRNGQNAFKSGDFSMLGGVQLNLLKLKLTGRYFAGLNNINDIDDSHKWKNQGFQFSLGLRLL